MSPPTHRAHPFREARHDHTTARRLHPRPVAARHAPGTPGSSCSGTAGYDPVAPGWPGDPDTVDEARANPELIADHGIDDVVEHYAEIIADLASKPILDRALLRRHDRPEAARAGPGRRRGRDRRRPDQGRAAAAAVGAAGHPAGVQEPGEQAPGGLADRRAVPLRASATPSRARSPTQLYERWTIPAPGKPLFEAAAANFNPHSPAKVDTANEMRGPLLLIMGGKDHTVPEAVTRSTLKQYRHSDAVTDIHRVPRPGALPDHRQRLARGRRLHAGLARAAVARAGAPADGRGSHRPLTRTAACFCRRPRCGRG